MSNFFYISCFAFEINTGINKVSVHLYILFNNFFPNDLCRSSGAKVNLILIQAKKNAKKISLKIFGFYRFLSVVS
jgi:hypothetical protein